MTDMDDRVISGTDMVYKMARRAKRKQRFGPTELDDLVQAGMLALINASRIWTGDGSFIQYASVRVRYAIQEERRRMCTPVEVPRKITGNHYIAIRESFSCIESSDDIPARTEQYEDNVENSIFVPVQRAILRLSGSSLRTIKLFLRGGKLRHAALVGIATRLRKLINAEAAYQRRRG